MTLLTAWLLSCDNTFAQELNAKVTFNTSQIEGTDKSVFDDLQQAMERMLNEKQWTNLQFKKNRE